MEPSNNARALNLSPDITDLGTAKQAQSDSKPATTATPNEEENDGSKIRRSTRIKKLESSRGGARRREVVFSKNSDRESITSRSFEQDEDSNSTSNSGSGMPASNSFPNLASLSLSSSTGELGPTSGSSTSTPTTPSYQSSTMKLKSRWRYSLDAESFKSSVNVGTSDSINNVSCSTSVISSLGSDGTCINPSDMASPVQLKQNPNLISRPGHILADSTDTELMDKLKEFEGIEQSIFLTERYVSKEGRGMVCDCFLTREEIARGDIGCNDDCLNRLLMVECGGRCPTGDRCTNKSFQRKQYCGLEVFRTEQKGHGLRTTQALPAGGFVIEYVGEVLDPREFKQRTREYAKGNQEHFYFMALKSDSIIDATLKGNCSRFINHSCEPNCETQKWTVNGELRIGFFAIKDLDVGDEITFDYQFQRYGKKAQQCFCMTPSCRGWIGGEQEDGTAKESERLRLRAEKKKKERMQWEDVALEEELQKLETTGLRNKAQTLNLCRLMVRADDWDARERILTVLNDGDRPCLRLFLDYHGLKLLWAWMLNLPLPSPDAEIQLIRNDRYHLLFLKTLKALPIPNKTILQDSKVLQVIEKWSSAPPTSTMIIKKVKPEISEATSSDSAIAPEVIPPVPVSESVRDIDTLEQQLNDVEIQPVSTTSESMEIGSGIPGLDLLDQDSGNGVQKEQVTTTISPPEADDLVTQELKWEFVETAQELLNSWEELTEVFRIPKKERLEQMKKHERAADISGGLSALIRRPTSNLSTTGPYGKDSRLNKGKPKFERKVPVLDFSYRDRERQAREQRPSISVPYPQSNLSKEERRHLFAAQVAREEEEERNRQMQDSMVVLHQERCANLGLDAATVPILDPTCTYYLEPSTVTWREIDLNDPTLPPELALIVRASQQPDIPESFDALTPEPEFTFPPWPEGLAPPPPLPPAVLPRGWRMAVDDEGRCYYYDIRSRQTQWNPPSPDTSAYNSSESSDSDTSGEEEEIEENKSPSYDSETPKLRLKVSDRSERRKKSGLVEERIISPRDEDEKPTISQKSIRSKKLQLMERKIRQEALEARGLGKNNDEEADMSAPVVDPVLVQEQEGQGSEELEIDNTLPPEPGKDTDSVESDDTNVPGESISVKTVPQSSVLNENEMSTTLPGFSPVECQEDSAGLATEKPSTSSGLSPTSDETISLVRGHPASTSLTPALSKLADKKAHRKTKAPNKRLEVDKHKLQKQKSVNIEIFRSQIANVIVEHLNPYRKAKCPGGRITSNEDFKHLARKMTHAIALKELKHCRDGKSLVVSESVKHKTKEYVKKYMAKYEGRDYIKSPDEARL